MQEHLAVYLNDHLAGSAGALQLLSTLASWPEETSWAQELSAAIKDDQAQLEALMNALSVARSPVRQAAGWIGERLATLKTRLDDSGGGTLQRLEFIEALALGVEGKRSLWALLRDCSRDLVALQRLDYERLIDRAEEQRQLLEAHRIAAAKRAFQAA